MNYLLQTDEIIKNRESITAETMMEWWEGQQKVLAILSGYDTGKTSGCKKVLKELNPKKVLFISYRQTLSYDLAGNFPEFKLYLDGHYDADKLICQVDSLEKTLYKYMFNRSAIVTQKYDLVIIDEIESVLMHFRSDTLKNKENLFDVFHTILHNSKKILALDGDFSNRSYEFLKTLSNTEPLILENKVKKGDKHYIFTNDRTDYERRIAKDLADKKNVVIVSMSNTIATRFYDMYKDKYKSVLHSSSSDDELKKELKKVEEYWQKFQLVIYSPTIEAGVNFDCPHFYSLYVILCSKSTSARGLTQMLSRVRQIINKNIYVYLNNMPYRDTANFFTYSEIKKHVMTTSTQYLPHVKVMDPVSGEIQYKCDFNLYAKMLVYNEIENHNKGSNYFVAYLIKLVTSKGNTIEHINIKVPGKTFDKAAIMKQEIINAKDIDTTTYSAYKTKKMGNDATRAEKVAIEKYDYKKNWKVDAVDEEFLDKYYNKTYMLENLRNFLHEERVDPFVKMRNNDRNVSYDRTRIMEQNKAIKEVLSCLGFNGIDKNVMVDKDTFEKNIVKAKKTCFMFAKSAESQLLFDLAKTKIYSVVTDKKEIPKIIENPVNNEIDSVDDAKVVDEKKKESNKKFMGFINSLLSDWGMVISHVKKHKKINNIGSTIYFYNLCYIMDINKYI